MKFAVGMGRNERIDEIAEHSRVAEASGFSYVTFVDQQNVSRDVFVMMTLAASSTSRIKIGHGVTQPFTYHPSVIANGTATVNELSGGRAFVGIGAGGNALRTLGMKPRSMKELREAVEFIKKYTSGQEAEFKGARMHSEWIRHRLPVYMACTGPKACQMAGEIADGVIFSGADPVLAKWTLEQIEKGAQKAGRDSSQIDTWVRTLIYIAETPDAPRREVASYAATWARGLYSRLLLGSAEIIELRERIEAAHPGLIDELKSVHDNYDDRDHERTDAKHANLVSQRVIDFFLLTGNAEDIAERISKLQELGVKTISTVTYTVVDKKGSMREIGNRVIPFFKN